MKDLAASLNEGYKNISSSKAKLIYLFRWLKDQGFESHVILKNAPKIGSKLKGSFSVFPSFDFQKLFSKKEIISASAIKEFQTASLFSQTLPIDLNPKGFVTSILKNGAADGGLYLHHSKIDKTQLFLLLNLIKHLIGSCLDQISLNEKLKKKSSALRDKVLEIESLFDITELLNSDQETTALFENLLGYLVFTINASKGVILTRDQNAGIFELAAFLNVDASFFKNKIIRDSKGILELAKTKSKSFLLDPSEKFVLSNQASENCLVGPIFSDGILFGCILLFDKESRDHLNKFDAKDLRLFDSILKKIELAYNNILLVDSIKNSKKLIDSIMSSITTGIIKIDLLGEIEYINDSALEIFNFQQENVLNNHYAMVFENNDQLLELLEFAETKEHIFYEENILIYKENKETTQVNLTISPVFDEGSNSGVVISFEDLSDINKVKTTFKKYVSESIVDELLLNDSSLELGGKEQEVCVLFCDIRGFTAMSEKLEPSKVVFLLNHYFEIMIRVLFKNKGTLDKIIGDELMVLFGVPEKDEQDVDNAIRTAKEMFVVLDQFNVEMQKKDLPEIRVGIGINYGKVISGNIGSSQQMNYTVIGDNVNLAARLCSAAKSNEVIISESVFEKLEEKQGFIKNQDLKVKGKSNAIKNWKFTHSELEQIKT